MSFIKIQKINPNSISSPDVGNIYLGQDNIGLWEKDEFGNITYVQSGNTYNTFITGSTSSGTSGINGSSGKDGVFLGSSGTSGKTGINGTVGTSGSSGNSSAGTSGTTGVSGSSGTSSTSGTSSFGSSGLSGSSGSSGQNGFGSSGTSGFSGIDGGYGGTARLWIFTGDTTPNQNCFNAYNNTYSSNDLSLIEYIRINQRDADNQDIDGWLNTWNTGLLKIEERRNAGNFGIYIISSGTTKIGLDIYQMMDFTIASGNGNLVNGEEYLISFVHSIGDINFYSGGTSGIGTSGTSGTSGSSGISGSSGTSGSGILPYLWVVNTPQVGGNPGLRLYDDMTILRIDSFCIPVVESSTGTTVTFNIEDRTIIGTTGTTIYSGTTVSSGLSEDVSIMITKDHWLWLDISNVVDSPNKLVVSVALK